MHQFHSFIASAERDGDLTPPWCLCRTFMLCCLSWPLYVRHWSMVGNVHKHSWPVWAPIGGYGALILCGTICPELCDCLDELPSPVKMCLLSVSMLEVAVWRGPLCRHSEDLSTTRESLWLLTVVCLFNVSLFGAYTVLSYAWRQCMWSVMWLITSVPATMCPSSWRQFLAEIWELVWMVSIKTVRVLNLCSGRKALAFTASR